MSVCAYYYRMTNTVSTNISRQKKIDKISTIFHLSYLDWADIKVVCDLVMAFKLAQETLEGELYIIGSRVVAIHEKIRADLILTHLEWADSEKGTCVLTSVIEGFETRSGDSSNVCEVDCEGPSRQPRGYTKMCQ